MRLSKRQGKHRGEDYESDGTYQVNKLRSDLKQYCREAITPEATKPSVEVEEDNPRTYPKAYDNAQEGLEVSYEMPFPRSERVDFVQRIIYTIKGRKTSKEV